MAVRTLGPLRDLSSVSGSSGETLAECLISFLTGETERSVVQLKPVDVFLLCRWFPNQNETAFEKIGNGETFFFLYAIVKNHTLCVT